MHDAKDPGEVAQWHRWFGIECNNRAWRLAESSTRTPAETEEMVHAAHAAALHWGKVGNELNRMRGAMLLGHVHALAGDGTLARRYAQQAFDYVTSHDSPPWEVAFAHAVLANAASASGDADVHARHYGIARDLGAALGAEDRAIFEATFRGIPAPESAVARR
jgi:hypothetical protein